MLRLPAMPRPEIAGVDADSPLAGAVSRLREGNGPCLQVLEHGQTVGLLTLENVGEFLMVRAALAEQPKAPGSAPRRQPAAAVPS